MKKMRSSAASDNGYYNGFFSYLSQQILDYPALPSWTKEDAAKFKKCILKVLRQAFEQPELLSLISKNKNYDQHDEVSSTSPNSKIVECGSECGITEECRCPTLADKLDERIARLRVDFQFPPDDPESSLRGREKSRQVPGGYHKAYSTKEYDSFKKKLTMQGKGERKEVFRSSVKPGVNQERIEEEDEADPSLMTNDESIASIGNKPNNTFTSDHCSSPSPDYVSCVESEADGFFNQTVENIRTFRQTILTGGQIQDRTSFKQNLQVLRSKLNPDDWIIRKNFNGISLASKRRGILAALLSPNGFCFNDVNSKYLASYETMVRQVFPDVSPEQAKELQTYFAGAARGNSFFRELITSLALLHQKYCPACGGRG